MEAAPGDRALVPDRVTEVALGDKRWPVEGGAAFQPTETGLHFLLAESDTIGALAVNPDPRESDLEPATDADIRGLWPGVCGLGHGQGRVAPRLVRPLPVVVLYELPGDVAEVPLPAPDGSCDIRLRFLDT